MSQKRLLLSTKETAQLLGISVRTLYRLRAAGRIDLKPKECGTLRKFLAADVEKVARKKKPWR